MSKIDDGGPAMPVHSDFYRVGMEGRELAMYAEAGMSLRDWFAGMAMQGFLSAPEVEGQTARLSPAVVAEWAYQNADAMLAARKT